ncbi:hypothetical protein N7532_002414 [Penicillium argentinense]|uniref:Uncharacterized protein n=1 Tax=Penicillium argentinense TaxID=1131581 RepID=A0A9W9KK89_9EURO|nr:uncharacterized protein N7532_002414 [Penicillium argentinense]KAJ5109769.1 hypothetical protein N7532_002414 [Penicillium argentinense]
MPVPIEELADPQSDQLQAVGKAFDALLLTLYRLTNRHNDLKQHAEEVFKEYSTVTRQLAVQDRPHAMEVQQRLLDQQKQLCLGLVHNKPPVEEQSLNSMDVIKTLVSHQNVDETAFRAILDGVKGYKALIRSQDGSSPNSNTNSCILARGPDPSVSLEQDFTTNGTQGSLHCPFSKPRSPRPGGSVQNGHPQNGDGPKIRVDTCGNPDLDPIKAEQDERRPSTTPSARTSGSRCPVSRCPIRFLDQHSPEEIAEYVERHKHEIPRSHAICVKRYQRDPQNMRQLDAKYGGLINMISGLSAKHQAFLPQQANGNGDAASHSASTGRVEKWAENVDPTTPVAPHENGIENGEDRSAADIGEGEEDDDNNRKSHFDRPLREVRVGESPSRPWGIPVPLAEQPSASVPFSGSVSGPMAGLMSPPAAPPDALDASPGKASTKPAGRCPFGHGAPKPEPEAEKPASPWANWGKSIKEEPVASHPGVDPGAQQAQQTQTQTQRPTEEASKTEPPPAHVTFNGPVFFGYSAEQTASLMQQLGHLGAPKPNP